MSNTYHHQTNELRRRVKLVTKSATGDPSSEFWDREDFASLVDEATRIYEARTDAGRPDGLFQTTDMIEAVNRRGGPELDPVSASFILHAAWGILMSVTRVYVEGEPWKPWEGREDWYRMPAGVRVLHAQFLHEPGSEHSKI